MRDTHTHIRTRIHVLRSHKHIHAHREVNREAQVQVSPAEVAEGKMTLFIDSNRPDQGRQEQTDLVHSVQLWLRDRNR